MSSRLGNWFLNLTILIALGIAGALGYAFFQRTTMPEPDPRRLDNPTELLGDIIQVEVLNACGLPGAARDVMEKMRDLGFDVVEVGNHSRQDLVETRIVDRVGNLDAARQVALALGLPEDRISEDIRADYFLDVSILVGSDYSSLPAFVNQ